MEPCNKSYLLLLNICQTFMVSLETVVYGAVKLYYVIMGIVF